MKQFVVISEICQVNVSESAGNIPGWLENETEILGSGENSGKWNITVLWWLEMLWWYNSTQK